MHAADFTITLENEARVLTDLTNELQTLTVEIKQSLAEVEDNVEREGSEIRKDIKRGEEEMRKVCHYTLYCTERGCVSHCIANVCFHTVS